MSLASLGILMPLLVGAGPSAPAAEPDPLAAAAPLMGRWVADPDPRTPGASGWMTVERGAGGRALLRRNHAEYPPTKDRAAFTHDDLLLLFSENGQLRADYLDNEGHVIRYLVQAPNASTLVFVSDATAPGPRFRLTYTWPSKDRIDLTFEIAAPGPSTEFKPYIQARLHRGSN